jgi:hypothetical protein
MTTPSSQVHGRAVAAPFLGTLAAARVTINQPTRPSSPYQRATDSRPMPGMSAARSMMASSTSEMLYSGPARTAPDTSQPSRSTEQPLRCCATRLLDLLSALIGGSVRGLLAAARSHFVVIAPG